MRYIVQRVAGRGNSLAQVEAMRGTLCRENFKTIIKLAEPQSAFYYPHVPEFPNNVNEKILLP